MDALVCTKMSVYCFRCNVEGMCLWMLLDVIRLLQTAMDALGCTKMSVDCFRCEMLKVGVHGCY